MKKIREFGYILALSGAIILFFNFSITGAIIGVSLTNNFLEILSITLLITGIFLLLITRIENKVTSSKVKKDPLLLRVAKQISRKDAINRDVNHLISELNKGNTNPGIGTKTIFSGVYELRGRNEGRVYYQEKNKGEYEILGYSDKDSQEKVISRLRKLYS